MKNQLALWLVPSLCLSLGFTQANAARPSLEKPVILESIPGPGEARAIMAERDAAKKREAAEASKAAERRVAEAQRLEAERRAAVERKLAEQRRIAWEQRLIAERKAAADQRRRTQEGQQITAPTQPPMPRPASPQPGPGPDSIEARLGKLQQQRARGEISGEQYLAQRHQLIYGYAPLPARSPANRATAIEQRLASLVKRRSRGEISGDVYLAHRKAIISGQ